MSNIDAVDQAPLGISQAPAASTLIGQKPNPWFNVLAGVVVVAGIIYTGIHLANDLSVVRDTRAYPYILLGIALLIALGFEFVNGFHDTANAVATVIYTNSMSPNLAVVWSGFFNFAGVLVSTGAVAFGIVSLLPVELISSQAQTGLSHYAAGAAPADPHAAAMDLVRARSVTPQGVTALAALTESIAKQVDQYHSIDKVPAGSMVNIRNDMYLVSEGLRFMGKAAALHVSGADKQVLDAYKKQLDHSTKFIPTWVKVAVAIALGLGTMIGWKRIVVTVGERIGKTHLTYAQGASAEIVAMATIGAAEMFGLPVSTTHVLSSGVAGTMVANHSGLQWATVRNLLMAWVLTLPVSIALAGSLYWLLRHFL